MKSSFFFDHKGVILKSNSGKIIREEAGVKTETSLNDIPEDRKKKIWKALNHVFLLLEQEAAPF